MIIIKWFLIIFFGVIGAFYGIIAIINYSPWLFAIIFFGVTCLPFAFIAADIENLKKEGKLK
jgi:hypothetical protein